MFWLSGSLVAVGVRHPVGWTSSPVKLPRHAEIWLPGYLKDRLGRSLYRQRVRRLWVMLADHFEPYWHNQDHQLAWERVWRWRQRWPQIAARHQDSRGAPPKYCFFYPIEEYRPELLDLLAEMVHQGVADVEVHLHHDRDSREGFLSRVGAFLETLHQRHGLLRKVGGRIVFGFIHGNWTLDNSHPQGQWCGLNDELSLLKQLGCYADFTMPCGPLPMQARLVNTIYWALDDPARPKSYDTGIPVRAGRQSQGDLLMIPGPLGLRWAGRLAPRMETGELAHYDPPSFYRARRWAALSPQIREDRFLKLYTHGAQEKNSALLLGEGLDRLFEALRAECRRRGWELRYVTAWQMRQAVEAAVGRPAISEPETEAGASPGAEGDVGLRHRDRL